MTYLDDGTTSFSQASMVRFSDALGVSGGVIAAGVSATGIGAQLFQAGGVSTSVRVDDARIHAADNLRMVSDDGGFVTANASAGNFVLLRYLVDGGALSIDEPFGEGPTTEAPDGGFDDAGASDADDADASDADAESTASQDADAKGLVVLTLPTLLALGKVTRLGNDVCASVTIGSTQSAYAAVICAVYTP